jgi:7,8-dihydropterin-6-yl-methyl-4-(beta-D-ribofuranosyl)aminobenzene 5'-phosphate synthase
VKEDGSDFLHLDDTGLAIKTEKGLVIISGCAHSGICNTICHAVKVTGEKRVHAVLGGFHLKDVDEKLNYTIDFLNETKVENVILAHCTSERCILEFEKRLTAQTQVFGAGKVFEF